MKQSIVSESGRGKKASFVQAGWSIREIKPNSNSNFRTRVLEIDRCLNILDKLLSTIHDKLGPVRCMYGPKKKMVAWNINQAEVERVLKYMTQVEVLLLEWNFTEVGVRTFVYIITQVRVAHIQLLNYLVISVEIIKILCMFQKVMTRFGTLPANNLMDHYQSKVVTTYSMVGNVQRVKFYCK